MEREEAIAALRSLIGQDLVPLAYEYGVTIWKEGHLNKGWAGQVIERRLGLPLNARQRPNFGSWELKLVSLKRLKSGKIVPKETMAITMIDPVNVEKTPFEESHLLAKLRKMVVCARMFESHEEKMSHLISVGTFDLGDRSTYEQVKRDYEEVRRTIQEKGFDALSGRMGLLVQPRTKGMGHGSTTRAFYARKELVKIILGLTND